MAADDAAGAAGLGAAEKSLDSRSKAAMSSIVFYRAGEDQELNTQSADSSFLSSYLSEMDSPPWGLQLPLPLLLPFSLT